MEGYAHPIARAIRAYEELGLIGVDGVTQVLLVRHGDCYQGLEEEQKEDPPLSPAGRLQAQALARRLQDQTLDEVRSSTLLRARQTADALGQSTATDARLCEVDIDWSGGMRFTESIEEVAARVGAAVDDAVADHPGGRVALVSHGGAIMAYVSRLLELPPPGVRLIPRYTSITVVRAKGSERAVESIADASHLDAAP